MKNGALWMALAWCVALAGLAQTSPDEIRPGARISAQLEAAVDTRTAKPGMEVPARVIKDVKQDGRIVIHKGDLLIGRVVASEERNRRRPSSFLSIEFDQLRHERVTSRLDAVVIAVVPPPQEADPPDSPTAIPGMKSGFLSDLSIRAEHLRLGPGTRMEFRVIARDENHEVRKP